MNAERERPGNSAGLDSAGEPRLDRNLLNRIAELLQTVADKGQPEVSWEIGLHVNGLSETVKEMSVHVGALEEESRTLQERLEGERREYTQLRESMDELLNLNELSEAISTSFNIEDILQALMDLSGRVIDYASCGVFALSADGSHLTPLVIRGETDRPPAPASKVTPSPSEETPSSSALIFQARVQAQWDDGIIDWVLREGQPVVIDDMESVQAKNRRAAWSSVVIPLMVGGKKIGVFTLYCRKAKDDFTLGEIELLGVLANQTAVAIENSRLYADLEISHQQLKVSQRQLIMSAEQAAIGELAGGVAHEVNNSLQIILSRVQLMIAKHQDKEDKFGDGLKLVEDNVRRISKIIRALLGFASHNTANAEWAPFELSQAIQQANALVRHQLEGQLIEVEIDLPEDLPPLFGNVGELEQVFINLMLNAQNAMPAGGSLQISARLEGEEMEVRFTDSGEGILPEHLDRIFEPFFTTRAGEGGTGLGLAVSYRIVDTHEGRLTVGSKPGDGATFILRLPLRPPLHGQERDDEAAIETSVDSALVTDS